MVFQTDFSVPFLYKETQRFLCYTHVYTYVQK